MLTHPQFDPVAIHLGSFGIHWYGLMYLLGFVTFIWLGRRRLHALNQPGWDNLFLDDLLFYCVLGVILGGRLGYVLFYKPGYYAQHPLEILAVWQGGMAFHGGFLGVLVAIWWVARKHGLRWLEITDFSEPAGSERELWGRVTDVAWGMVFQNPAAGPLPRHPSQLYQFLLEGIVLFVILWLYSAKPRPAGAVSALFLIGYGVARFAVEFFREPDDFLGLLALGLSMGQWLSLPMIAAGVLLFAWSKRRS